MAMALAMALALAMAMAMGMAMAMALDNLMVRGWCEIIPAPGLLASLEN
jgi:hypothetical protein